MRDAQILSTGSDAPDRVVTNADFAARFGEKVDDWLVENVGIPMALDDAMAQGKGPKPGELVVFCASGGGIALAASLWRWS